MVWSPLGHGLGSVSTAQPGCGHISSLRHGAVVVSRNGQVDGECLAFPGTEYAGDVEGLGVGSRGPRLALPRYFHPRRQGLSRCL